MEVRDISIKKVKPYPNNAKIHPDHQIEQIAKSIEMFGWAQPLVIDNNNVVVIGHGRLMAAEQLGLDTVPCVVIDDLTEDEIRMLRLADNKLNESPWDFDLLADELEGLDFGELDLDFGITGFTDEELEALMTADMQERAKKGFEVVAKFNSENEANNCLDLLTEAGYTAEIK